MTTCGRMSFATESDQGHGIGPAQRGSAVRRTGFAAGVRKRSGSGTLPAVRPAGYCLKAASKEVFEAGKSNFLSAARASGAPWSRSMPASSHSTEMGPS